MTRRGGGQAGFSLIELLVAVLVLSVGVIAAMRSVGHSTRVLAEETDRLMAQTVALNRAEELRLIGAARGRSLPRAVAMGRTDWQVSMDEAPSQGGLVEVTIAVTAPGRPGARLVTYVLPDRRPGDAR